MIQSESDGVVSARDWVRARLLGALLWVVDRPGFLVWAVLCALMMGMWSCRPAYAQFSDIGPGAGGQVNVLGGFLGGRRTGQECSAVIRPDVEDFDELYRTGSCSAGGDPERGRVVFSVGHSPDPNDPCPPSTDENSRMASPVWASMYRAQGNREGAMAYIVPKDRHCEYVVDYRFARRLVTEPGNSPHNSRTSCTPVPGVSGLWFEASLIVDGELVQHRDVGIACGTGLEELKDVVFLGLGVSSVMTVLFTAAGLVGGIVVLAGGGNLYQWRKAQLAQRQADAELKAYGVELAWRMEDSGEPVAASFGRLIYEARRRGMSDARVRYYLARRRQMIRAGLWRTEYEHGYRESGSPAHAWDADDVRVEDYRA